jgi:hypothetical protein
MRGIFQNERQILLGRNFRFKLKVKLLVFDFPEVSKVVKHVIRGFEE